MKSAKTAAQAKINLRLRVLTRESSGYHQIETVFQRLDLADDVTVHVGGGSRTISCNGDAMPEGGLGPQEANLASHRVAAKTPDHGFSFILMFLFPGMRFAGPLRAQCWHLSVKAPPRLNTLYNTPDIKGRAGRRPMPF